jgi:mono/diheme cytochrome c family protein
LDVVPSRVPSADRAAAKAMKNPIAKTPENIAKGKALFEGQGTCMNCHGLSGKGDGPAGVIFPIAPRNFTNPKFHKNRTDGEMMWVLKHGSNGPNGTGGQTPMVPLVPAAISEEQGWFIILYERSFEGK